VSITDGVDEPVLVVTVVAVVAVVSPSAALEG
jgi:hypothetical protein